MRRTKPKPQFWRSKHLVKPPEEMDKWMSGKAARAKGKAFEQKVAVLFREVFPHARRWLENHKDDAKGIDLVNTGVYRVQLKRLKLYAPITAIFQVQCDEMMGEVPVLVTAGDSQPAMAVVPLEHFLWLVKRSF